MSRGRVAVTGIGALSSVGIGVEAYWDGLLAGRNGVGSVPELAALGIGVDLGGMVTDFRPEDFMTPAQSAACGRTSQLGIAATRLALEDAGLGPDGEETGVFLGTTMGEANVQEGMVAHIFDQGTEHIRLSDVQQVPDSAVALNVCKVLGLDGPCLVFPTACAAGNYALGYGYDLIRRGRVRRVVAGGCDAFSKIAFMGFGRMLALAPDCCRPFDRDRRGIAVGEGAGVVVLEDLAVARARGARVHAEMLGYGLSCDAHHMTIPHRDGLEAVMARALEGSGTAAEDIDLVCAHGTGTRINDATEYSALAAVFGPRLDQVPVVSVKSMLGHTMGAASALEAIACMLAVRDGAIPPTINFVTPDEACPVDCVPNRMRRRPLRRALNNAFAFGGNNAATVFGRYEG